MSFSRAKVFRFNEVQNTTPSPADYNPKIKNRVGGAVIPHSERFAEQCSPAVSESVSILSTNSSTPCFRTPTLPRKKKPQKATGLKSQPSDLFCTADDVEALQEKIVECNNKDLYINELTEQIEEMKAEVSMLQVEREQLIAENNQYTNKTELILKEHFEQLENLALQHNSEVQTLNNRLTDSNTQLNLLRKDHEKLKLQDEHNKERFQKNIDDVQCLYKSTVQHHEDEIKNRENTIKLKDEELDKLHVKLQELQRSYVQVSESSAAHKKEVETIELDLIRATNDLRRELELEKINTLNKITELTDQKRSEINLLRQQHNEEKVKLQRECEAQVRQIEENCKEANLLAEMQMQEKLKDIELTCKIKLEEQEKQGEEILKECQAISEYNIIQCEVEKNKIKHQLLEESKELDEIKLKNEELLHSLNDIEQVHKNLKSKFKQVVAELNSVEAELKKEVECRDMHVQQIATDKHTYEVTISKTHKTVEALKKRLFDSDKDVEQLKLELENCEASKLEFESKCNVLSEELEIVKKMNDDLELQNESCARLTEEKIQKVERELHVKINDYKQTADDTVRSVNDKLEQKTSELEEVLEQLHRQQILNSEAQSLIQEADLENDRLTTSNTDYKYENNRLSISVKTLQTELQTVRENFKQLDAENKLLVRKLNDQLAVNNELKAECEESKLKNEEVESLMKQINQLQEKSESYYKYCEYYKRQTSEYEREIEDMNKINKNYIDQSRRYDELLQKFDALTVKNSELEKTVAEQESLIGPFREQLESYEMERVALLSQKSGAESEAKAMGMKYADLMGHQNQKQKIKHILDLKIKNHELKDSNVQLDQKVRSQATAIEKLKKELATLKKTSNKNVDKENLNKSNITLNSSLLRERN